MPHVNERRDDEPAPEGREGTDGPDASARSADDLRGGPIQPAGGQRLDPSTDDAGLPMVEVTDEGDEGSV